MSRWMIPFVWGFQRIGNLNAQIKLRPGLERPALDALSEGPPFEKLHHNERLALVLSDLVKCADVRVVEC
jgi:hypothetical protein